jgi:hypothetical protein
MSWQSIFSLGDCDIFWIDSTGAVRPRSELAAGTITVVGDNLVATGIRTPYTSGGDLDPDGVYGIAVVPLDPAMQGLAVRCSVVSISRPAAPVSNAIAIDVSVGQNIAGDYTPSGESTDLQPIWEGGIPQTVVIDTDPNDDIELGEFDEGAVTIAVGFTAVDQFV